MPLLWLKTNVELWQGPTHMKQNQASKEDRVVKSQLLNGTEANFNSIAG